MQVDALRILIADDSAVLRRTLSSLLLQLCPEWTICGEAQDGEEALAMIESLSPDVVLLDLSLPKISGLEVARALEARKTAARVIFMSAQDALTLGRVARSFAVQWAFPKSTLAFDLPPLLKQLAAEIRAQRRTG